MCERTNYYSKIIFVIVIKLLFFSAPVFANGSEVEYQSALKLARQGKTQQSISIFQKIIKQHPETLRFKYDYIQVLSWADQNDDIISYANEIKLKHAPVYVLEAVARAHRNKKQFSKAEGLYRLALQKIPDRFNSKLGLALVLIDNKKTDQALKILLSLKQKHADEIGVFSALGYAYETQGSWFNALAAYDRILALAPNNDVARRTRIFMLDKIGASTLANEEAKRFAPLFSKEEMAKIRWNKAAFMVRSGKIGTADGVPRFAEIDEAIRHIKENIEFSKTMAGKSSKWWQTRAHFDLIVALHARHSMQQVIDGYVALEQQNVDFPSYVLFPVADAYLYLEQPIKARDLYQVALNKTSGQKETEQIFYAKISLYFALLEAEQNKEATAWIGQLANSLPNKLKFRKKAKGPERSKVNSRKLTAEILVAMDLAYNDDLKKAQVLLENLLKKAPNNQDIRGALVNIYYWRGWPRKAEKLYQQVNGHEPDNKNIQISQIQRLVDLKKYPQADIQRTQLMETHSFHPELQRQTRLWDIHNDWEFTFEVKGGESSGSQQGSRDINFESYLYAKPIAYKYRPFLHYKWGEGLFPEGRGSAHREGVGIEYSVPDWLFITEIHHNHFASNRFGGRIEVNYSYDDYWSFSAGFDSLSANTPLRALSSNVKAKSYNGGINYRVSESREFRINAGFMSFSDDNDRYSVAGSYHEQWLSGVRYKFATDVEIYHSGNSSSEGPYYSPSNDLSFGLTLNNEYLTYRYYDFTVHQNLKISGNGYWQEHFDTGWVGSILYEHQWSAWNKASLAYGITGFSRLYDADRENGWEAYLRVNWRF